MAARRQARAEAKEIRMREIERQQREADENLDKIYDITSNAGFNSGKFFIILIHFSFLNCDFTSYIFKQ